MWNVHSQVNVLNVQYSGTITYLLKMSQSVARTYKHLQVNNYHFSSLGVVYL